MPTIDDRPGSGARNDARDEQAVFAPTRVRAGRRPPFIAAGLAAAVVTLVALGAIDRLGGAGPPNVPAATLGAVAEASGPADTVTPTSRQPKRALAARSASPTELPGVFAVTLRPAGSHLFVHGDVYSLDVAAVVVSVEDAAGHVAKRQTIELRGDVRAARDPGTSHFDVQFDIPDEVMGEGVWVRAQAYDHAGVVLESERGPVIISALRRIDVAPGQAEPAAVQSPGAVTPPGLGEDFGSFR